VPDDETPDETDDTARRTLSLSLKYDRGAPIALA